MLTRGRTPRAKAFALAVVVLVTGGLAVGCGGQEADVERGRALFVDNCGTCHALTEARTSAELGPDLDAAFAAARETGMDSDTIHGVVRRQIEVPREVEESNPDYANVYMPANIVEGRDAEDVSAYVASVAGVEGIEPPELGSGEEIFTDLCAQCHTLAAANAAGTTGPDLDEVLPGQEREQVAESIRDPEAEITPGFEGGIMPPFDEGELPEDSFQRLLDFLIESAGQGG